MLLANFAHGFLACCWQYISSMLFCNGHQATILMCAMLRPWHLALPVLAQLCWRQHIWFNLWHCEMSTKFATLCRVECGQLSKNLQESLIVFSCQIVLHALTVWCLFMTCTLVFQRIWITLGGPQSASAADVRSFWLCQVPPQQNRWTSPPFDSSHLNLGKNSQARSDSGQRLSG